MSIAVMVGHVADVLLSIFAVLWIVLVGVYAIGLPFYFFDKLLKSPMGADVLLPFKFLLQHLRKARFGSPPDVGQKLSSTACSSNQTPKK